MNENINLTKILEGCPVGTKLYSSVFGNVYFKDIDGVAIVLTRLSGYSIITFCITKNGKYDNTEDAECVLFPSKDQRDWSKFERFWDKPKVGKFDPKTFRPFDKVLVGLDNGNEYEWHIDLFESFDEEVKVVVPLVHLINNHVIPYNDETKHLIGTMEEAPEYYKWWEK